MNEAAQIDPGEPAPSPRQRHIEMLLISGVVAVASAVLEVEPTGHVGVSRIPGCTLPPLCFTYAWFGIRCPGCGLTHSFVQLAHGHWQAAWAAHHLGWLLAGMVLLQIPYRIHSLYVWPRNLLSVRVRQWIGRCLIGLLVGNWLLQILF